MESFAVHSSERGEYTVVAVEGEVDLATSPRFGDALSDLIVEGHVRLVIDLTSTDFLDSTGLGALVTALKRVRAKGGDMRVVCTSAAIRKVFEISGLDRVVPVFATVDEACAGG